MISVLLNRRAGTCAAQIQRPASSKTFILAMPEKDAVLAKPPTQICFLTFDARGKIQQSGVEIFHDAPGGFNSF